MKNLRSWVHAETPRRKGEDEGRGSNYEWHACPPWREFHEWNSCFRQDQRDLQDWEGRAAEGGVTIFNIQQEIFNIQPQPFPILFAPFPPRRASA